MTSTQEPIVDVLEQVWASTWDATEGLTEDGWSRPSDLPGWTVKDVLSHVATNGKIVIEADVPRRFIERLTTPAVQETQETQENSVDAD